MVRYLTALVLLLAVGVVPVCAQESPKERRTVSFEFDFQEGVDDNPDGSGEASSFFELRPSVQFRQYHRFGSWMVEYQSTLRRFSGLSSQDQFDHELRLDGAFRLSRRWQVNYQQSFLRSTNPFLRVVDNAAGSNTVGSVLFAPNRSVVGPQQRYTRLGSNLTFQYRVGAQTQVSFGGDYFREDQPREFLLDQETRNFRVEFGKQYARGKSLGAHYSLQLFRTPAANTRVRTQSIVVSHGFEVRPGTRITFFGGPQVSRVRSEPIINLGLFFFTLRLNLRVRESVNTLAVGTLFAHRVNDRTWLEVTASRRVSEGGGFTGTVIQKAARVNFRREISRRLTTSIAAYIADDTALAGVGLSQDVQTKGFSTGFEYRLNRRLGLRAQYDYFHIGAVPEQLRSSLVRNRLSVGIHYSLGRVSLGR